MPYTLGKFSEIEFTEALFETLWTPENEARSKIKEFVKENERDIFERDVQFMLLRKRKNVITIYNNELFWGRNSQ